jgi:hypothetical protein
LITHSKALCSALATPVKDKNIAAQTQLPNTLQKSQQDPDSTIVVPLYFQILPCVLAIFQQTDTFAISIDQSIIHIVGMFEIIQWRQAGTNSRT